MWPDGLIIFQNFAIYINENLPNGIQNLPKSVRDFPNSKWTLKTCPRLWRFCQNGEILPNLVTLVRKNSISGTDRLQILTRFDKSTPPHDASSYYSSHQSFRERDSRLRRSCRTIRSETPACQSVEVYYVHVTIEIRGREPWSSGYGWRLMFERSWVQISQGRKYKEEEIWTKQDENTERERHKGGK